MPKGVYTRSLAAPRGASKEEKKAAKERRRLQSLNQLDRSHLTPIPTRAQEVAARVNGTHPAPKRRSRQPGSSMIRWTDEEWEKLRIAAVVQWRKHPELGLTPPLFHAAQKHPGVIAESRQRTIATIQSVEAIFDKVVAEARRICQGDTASIEPQVRVETHTLKVFATPEEVLAKLSLPRLAGFYHARVAEAEAEFRHQMVFATATGKMPTRSAAKEREEMLTDLGMKELKDVRTLYPKVCLVGFSSMHAQSLRDQLAKHPLNFFHRVDSLTPPSEDALPMDTADFFVVNKDHTPEPWQKLIQHLVQQNKIKPEKYLHGSSMERVRSALADTTVAWHKAHPELSKLHTELLPER